MSILDVDNLIEDDSIHIQKWLNENCKIYGTYTIKDNIVDVDGSVGLDFDVQSIDVQFGVVTRNFVCSHCKYLTSLKGCPREVGGTFDCSYCIALHTIDFLPEKVGKMTNMKGNQIYNIDEKLMPLHNERVERQLMKYIIKPNF
ncbi:MAG: hypothetical protein IKU29_11810 [Parabacteroides sp.]|nr:hypothetical protein [Parabacteroides sp.]